ncbi:hypothetical protein D3C84_548110 [compost metagenome]
MGDQARRRGIQDVNGVFDFADKRRDTRLACDMFGPRQGKPGCLRLQAADGNSCHHQFMGGAQHRRQQCGIQRSQQGVRLVKPTDQQQSSNLQIPRVSGVHSISVGLKRQACRFERLHWPAQVTRSQRNFGLGHHAARPCQRLFRPECARGAFHQRFRPNQIAELRHGDAAQRERGRIVTQRHPVQRPERITRRERPRCGCDQ